MKRITRTRRLTADEAAEYRKVREQVAEELPELIARHHKRMDSLEALQVLLFQLKAAREAKGLSLSDLKDLRHECSGALPVRKQATDQSVPGHDCPLR